MISSGVFTLVGLGNFSKGFLQNLCNKNDKSQPNFDQPIWSKIRYNKKYSAVVKSTPCGLQV